MTDNHFHLGAEEQPFDPLAALRAEGIPIPQPIEIAPATPVLADGSVPLKLAGTNPKEAAGAKKPGVWSVMPRWVTMLVGRVMQTGAAKYGKFNYRDTPIYASTYEDAIERHAQLWFDGEDNDPESGVSHLAHVIACALLLLDSQGTGKLVDDRQKTGLARRTIDDLEGLLKTHPFPERKG